MWGQHWGNIMDIVNPYPEVDIRQEVEAKLKQTADVGGLFHAAENFYVNMGLRPLPKQFWELSMFTKPACPDVNCQASSYDMFFPGDFRYLF